MARHRASAPMKAGFAAIFLLAVFAYTQLKSSDPSAVANGMGLLGEARNLQEDEVEGDPICEELFSGADAENLCPFVESCEEVAPETCCSLLDDDDRCITKDLEICESKDICVAEILPGGGGAARCLEDFEKNRGGGIIIYLILILYCFIGLAIICDDYFVPSLEKISDALDLSEDVAGATFMAAGSSAPELFVSLADNVFTNPPKNLGTGAVIGGGVFNVLVIIGLSCVFAGRDLVLNWRPFARDYTFYIASVLIFIGMVADDKIEFYEGLFLFLFYLCYVLFMVYNAKIFIWIDKKLGNEVPAILEGSVDPVEGETDEVKEEKAQAMKKYSSFRSRRSLVPERPESYFAMFKKPDNWKSAIWYVISLPINIMFRFTVPDCTFDLFSEDKEGKDENRRIGYSLSFTMCILWIGFLSHVLVYFVTVFGCMAGIDPSIMGLTFLAVGTNIPDALSSIIVAKAGKGDMAVANSIGSNVFDILVGLGLPWFIAALAFDEPVPVAKDDLITAVAFLFLSLLFLFLVVFFNTRWSIGFWSGISLLCFYVVYVVFELAISPLIL